MKPLLAFLFASLAFSQPPVVRDVRIPNEASTGTTLSKLAKLTGAPSTAIISGAGDTGGALGIVVSGAGTTGSATIQEYGQAVCVFDGATIAGHYVQISASVSGDCTDVGATFPTSGQVIGVVLSTHVGAGTYLVDLALSTPAIGGGGGVTIGNAVTGGTNNYNLIVDGSGNVGQEATLGAARFPALTGPVTTMAGSLATTIGAAQVTNAMLAGSIAATKLIGTDIATVGTLTAGATGAGFTVALGTSTLTGILPAANLNGHSVSLPLNCEAASASGTAYTCTTSPSFTPADGDSVLFETDIANTGSATLAVNGAAAATIKKQGGGANLVANDLLANQWTVMLFDGTNWQDLGPLGNAPTGGTVTSVGQSFTGGLISVAGSPITSSGTLALTVAGTSGGVPYFSGAATWASSGALASGQFMLGGGAGSAPTTSFSVVPIANGGTNGTDAASNGGVVYSNATQYKVLVGTATANQALLSGSSAAPAWSTATYPPTTTINQILYSSAANTIAGLATANNAVFVTSAGGVPSVAAPSANLQVSGSVLDTIQGIQTTSTPQFARLGLGQAADATALLAGTKNTLNTTTTTLALLQNTTASTVSQQQISPAIELDAHGWGTTGAADQLGQVFIENFPIKDTTVANNLRISYKEAGGAQTVLWQAMPVVTAHTISALYGPVTPSISNYSLRADSSGNTFLNGSTNTTLSIGNSAYALIGSNLIQVQATSGITFATTDISLVRSGVGVLDVGNAQAGGCGTAANCRFLKLGGLYKGGATFTASGCSNGTLVGGATAGKFTLGANNCNVVITMGNSATAANGWGCAIEDQTTAQLTAGVYLSASNTTTATITVPATAGATDVISFSCDGY